MYTCTYIVKHAGTVGRVSNRTTLATNHEILCSDMCVTSSTRFLRVSIRQNFELTPHYRSASADGPQQAAHADSDDPQATRKRRGAEATPHRSRCTSY